MIDDIELITIPIILFMFIMLFSLVIYCAENQDIAAKNGMELHCHERIFLFDNRYILLTLLFVNLLVIIIIMVMIFGIRNK